MTNELESLDINPELNRLLQNEHLVEMVKLQRKKSWKGYLPFAVIVAILIIVLWLKHEIITEMGSKINMVSDIVFYAITVLLFLICLGYRLQVQSVQFKRKNNDTLCENRALINDLIDYSRNTQGINPNFLENMVQIINDRIERLEKSNKKQRNLFNMIFSLSGISGVVLTAVGRSAGVVLLGVVIIMIIVCTISSEIFDEHIYHKWSMYQYQVLRDDCRAVKYSGEQEDKRTSRA